jgi:acyl-CoA hydrolase
VSADEKPDRTPTWSQVEMTQMVLPGQTNMHGTAFGGQILAWIDIAAAVAAERHSCGPTVTAAFDEVQFVRGVRLGQVLVMRARVNWVGDTSMEVGVRVMGEHRGTSFHATSAYTTFVAIDDAGKPTAVPPLVLETDEDRRRWSEGAARAEQRQKRRKGKG